MLTHLNSQPFLEKCLVLHTKLRFQTKKELGIFLPPLFKFKQKTILCGSLFFFSIELQSFCAPGLAVGTKQM